MTQDNPLMNNPGGERPESLLTPGASSLPPSERVAAASVKPTPAVAPVPAPAAKPARPAGKASRDPEEGVAGVIDTVEAIIIALILALTFRAFVVEAFVIPTGSMAPTLLGAHFKVACPKCGHAYDENADLSWQYNQQFQQIGARELVNNALVAVTNHRVCQNCGYEIHASELPDVTAPKDMPNVANERPTYFPWANNGDRILVLKYLYSISSPQRFDVVVFKEPMFSRDNFIKRLIGLPGDTVEIINGDIYIGEGSAARGPDGAANRYIARKPRHVQDAIWQLIYDNDFYPTDEGQKRETFGSLNGLGELEKKELPVWHNPWVGQGRTEAAWTVKGPSIKYDADTAGTLHFTTGDEAASRQSGTTFYGANILGYDNDAILIDSCKRYMVGDLHLECVWTPTGAAGASLKMTLGKPEHRFQATLDATGAVRLDHWTGRSFEAVTPAATASVGKLVPGHPYKVELNNVDRHVELLVDGTVAAEYVTKWTAKDALASQNAEELSSPLVEIGVGGACTIGHLKLMRDLYYTQSGDKGRNQPQATPITAYAGKPLTLGDDEFFVLGDNSTFSHDGRTWEQVYPALDDLGLRRGVVPRRYLLGRAFFVYWPAGFRLFSTPAKNHLLNSPLIPNAGDMRFIR